VMRLRAQTAKIAGGFVLFPKEAAWLDIYLRELLSFPNSPNDDQVDSTVFALAWSTLNPEPGIITHYKNLAGQTSPKPPANGMVRVWVPGNSTHWILITGRTILIPLDRITEVTAEESVSILQQGGKRVD